MTMSLVEGLDYILPGDPRAADWGFTGERWAGSYLVLEGNRVFCSLLMASQHGRGYFRTLLQGIERSGHVASVPCPLRDMRAILEHYGFVAHDEDGADIWERPS